MTDLQATLSKKGGPLRPPLWSLPWLARGQSPSAKGEGASQAGQLGLRGATCFWAVVLTEMALAEGCGCNGWGHRWEQGRGRAAMKLPCETGSPNHCEHAGTRGQERRRTPPGRGNGQWGADLSVQHRASKTGQGVRGLEPAAQPGPSRLGLGVCPSAGLEAQLGMEVQRRVHEEAEPLGGGPSVPQVPQTPGLGPGPAWLQVQVGRVGVVRQVGRSLLAGELWTPGRDPECWQIPSSPALQEGASAPPSWRSEALGPKLVGSRRGMPVAGAGGGDRGRS